MTDINLSQKKFFNTYGFLIVKNCLDKSLLKKIDKIKKNFFKLKYETGIFPDKIKWIYSSQDKKSVRSQCNIWKGSKLFAKIVLSPVIGKISSKLMGWSGTRLNQDSLIWVMPNSGGVNFHQDNPYQDWNTPGKIITCWIPLKKTEKQSATLEYAVGSHKWGKGKTMKNFFCNDYKKIFLKKFINKKPIFKKIEINIGDVVFHHGNIWHGSGKNFSRKDRVSISIHLMSASSKFHPKINNPIFSRYKKFENLNMDESFFPITWSKNGRTSEFIKKYIG
jgi:phytanoyl-CoA hydroxylase